MTKWLMMCAQAVFNPATGAAEKKVALASKQTVEQAISAA